MAGVGASVGPGDRINVGPSVGNIGEALAQLPEKGGVLEFDGGDYTIADLVVPPNVVFRRIGGKVTLRVPGGTTGLTVGNDFILESGFEFNTPDPDAPATTAIRVVGKRTKLYAPKFTGFGNKVDLFSLDQAPYALVYQGADGVWADWNHLYSPHFEFVYGGLLTQSPANVMVSKMVARGAIGPGGGVRSHMSGSPAGAPLSIDRLWTAHVAEGHAAVQLTKDTTVTRPGGCLIGNWTNEPGAGRQGMGAYVESDGNYFTSAVLFIGGVVGFDWAAGAKNNVVDAYVTRNKQGGVGPPVDVGAVSDQTYR